MGKAVPRGEMSKADYSSGIKMISRIRRCALTPWPRREFSITGTMGSLPGFCIEASGKQALAVFYVDDGDIDPLVTRSDPCASSLSRKGQFALGEWRAALALEEHVFKRHGSVFIRKLASINPLMLVEPTFQPKTSLVQPKRDIVWQDVKCVGRNSMRSPRFMSYPQKEKGSADNNRSNYHTAEFPRSEAKQQRDNCSERSGAKHETRRQGHTNQTHHQKADSDKQSSELRVQLHHPPWTGMSFGIAIFHRLIVPQPSHRQCPSFPPRQIRYPQLEWQP